MATLPFGSWPSVISSEQLGGGSINLLQVKLDGDDTYWVEMRPHEARNVVVRRTPDGATADLTPEGFSARSMVYEAGTGGVAVSAGIVWFSNADDGRLYRHAPASDEPPTPIVPVGPYRYADPDVDHARERLLCIREEHGTSHSEPAHTIVSIALDGATGPEVLVHGSDFYAFPRTSPDGSQLAWIQWSHPNMPWDESELWIADLTLDGAPTAARRVAGGSGDSVYQPEWSPDGRLHFISERTGWWNLYRLADGEAVEALYEAELEFAPPLWWLAQPSYGFVTDTTLVCGYCEQGLWKLGLLDVEAGELRTLDLPYTVVQHVSCSGGRAVFLGGSPTSLPSVVELDLATGQPRVLRDSLEQPLDERYLPRPEPIAFPTGDGATAHAFFYPPTNPEAEGAPGELPPLIVHVHGGPSQQASAGLQFRLDYGAACFWTSRGFAVVDVNYGGSTGYGRAYRERLRGQWGTVDVGDAVAAARWLAGQGRVDAERLAIRGASAGGYTALSAVALTDTFKAAVSLYGPTDLEVFAGDTHKFESRYVEGLVPSDLLRARSPVHAVNEMRAAILIVHGLADTIVPADQSERIVSALRARGRPVEYVAHAGEGHGFRRAESIQASAEAELRFYRATFGIAASIEDAGLCQQPRNEESE